MWEKIKGWISMFGTFIMNNLFPAIVVGVIGWLVVRFVKKLLDKTLEKSPLEKTAHGLLKSVANIVLYVLLGLMIASTLGIDVSGVVALASVLSLAVSLSLQELLGNVIGGFTLLYTKPFTSGDFVEIAGQCGTVKEVGIAYTKLATPDNKTVSLPNSAVVAAQIINYTANGTRRVDIKVSASYDSPIDDVLEALKEAARVPTALADMEPFAGVKNYGDHAIEYELQLWSAASDFLPTTFAVNKRIKEVFDERGIQMTRPHLNVHLDKLDK